MSLYHFIKQESEIVSNRIVFMLIFSGLATGLLVSVINHAADTVLTQTVEGRILFLYLVVFLLYIYTQKYSLANTIYPLDNALYKLRLRLVAKAGSCDLREFETISNSELYHQLSHEINLAAQLLPWITYSAQATVILGFCLIYLAWLSVASFLIISLTLAVAVLWHLFVEKPVPHEFCSITAKELEFSQLLEILSRDAGELRLNHAKRKDFLASAQTISTQSEELKLTVDKQTISSIMSTRIVLFILLAIFLFIVPIYDPDEVELLFKITVVIFFIMGPITQLVYALPLLLRLDVALSSVYAFEARLDTAKPNYGGAEAENKGFASDFQELRLASASFAYSSEKGLFKEINLIVHQGEVIFVYGPGGSGKTTLLKLLCGLYAPDTGSMYVDKRKVTDLDYPYYRHLFVSAFRDTPPPSTIPTSQTPPDPAWVQALLERIGLKETVEYADGQFNYAPLSHTQQWRLMVVSMLLQKRPIYLFDDCSGGRDDEFTQLFYEEILEDLRNEGKTVVVVTQNKLFFHLADRVWEIHNGEVQISTPANDS
ncbi:ABC transporter ATP-binding protein [Thioploca ingrica]|uniref:ABC transporter ATP-binding protein n=1 Tax=Thioploca ingrica TaxID=40754 RepID=A0A090AFX7_9GAMM|nr:ABC transporter ATP-binding protein [Thioploca ingrica]